MSKIKAFIPNIQTTKVSNSTGMSIIARAFSNSSKTNMPVASLSKLKMVNGNIHNKSELQLPDFTTRLRGVAMTDEIFSQFDFYDPEMYETVSSNEPMISEPYQLSLELESKEEIEQKLRHQIKKYEYGYEKMSIYALRWYQLIEDISSDEELEQLFNDLQMLRKLRRDDLI